MLSAFNINRYDAFSSVHTPLLEVIQMEEKESSSGKVAWSMKIPFLPSLSHSALIHDQRSGAGNRTYILCANQPLGVRRSPMFPSLSKCIIGDFIGFLCWRSLFYRRMWEGRPRESSLQIVALHCVNFTYQVFETFTDLVVWSGC